MRRILRFPAALGTMAPGCDARSGELSAVPLGPDWGTLHALWGSGPAGIFAVGLTGPSCGTCGDTARG